MMKKVLLHTIFPDALNGPNTVNKMIRESALLKENYIIEDINQTTLPHKNPIKFWKLIRSLKRDIASRKADAIIVTGLQFAGFCCTLAARLAGVKHIIVCVHGYSGDAQGISRPMRWLYNHIIEPWTIKMCHCIYAVCDYGAGREMMKKYAKGKLYGTIHNCFPTPSQTPEHGFRAEVGIPENAVVLTSVGRVVADKGHREIIEATRRGLPAGAVVVIVGDGPFLDTYREECADLLGQGKLYLLGRRPDVLNILLETDIFIFPSHHENLSMALLEACYSGCAVIATNVDGNPEVISGKDDGVLIPVGDAEALHSAMVDLIGDAQKRELFAKNAFATQQREFSYTVFEERMKQLIDTVLKEN